jgi:hypothetical protein
MNVKANLLFPALVVGLCPVMLCPVVLCPEQASADETRVPAGKKRADFDLQQYKKFIDFDLSRPKPACAMTDMGIPGRSVEGQLVDHRGSPIAEVAVAIVEPIGYSGHCYYENFDTTDDQGRFEVEGSVAKTRLIFRKPSGRIWKVNVAANQRPIRVTWPEPATVTVQVSPETAGVGDSVSIQTRRYWAGMAVMRESAEINETGSAVFDDVIPGDYFVTMLKTIEVVGKQKSRTVEIGALSVAAGDQLIVQCEREGTVMRGAYRIKPSPIVGNLATFVSIQRDRQGYEDWPPDGDLLNLDQDGTFRSRPLSPGNYTIKVMAKGLAPPGRFGGGGDLSVRAWRVIVDGSSTTIDLDSIAEPGELQKKVEDVLQSAADATGRVRGESYAGQLKIFSDRSDAEQLLLRMLTDPACPYRWRRVIPEILQTMTDSPQVIAGLIDALDQPIDDRERGAVMRAFGSATQRVGEIVRALADECDDSRHITRGIAIRALGELAIMNPEQAVEIAELLERGLDDSWEATRLTAADYLGRIGSTNALPALLKTRDDVYGPVAVMAAYSAWKIGGDPEFVYPTMTAILNREGIAGMWEAAYFMKSVAEKHPVPEETRAALRRVAMMAGKPPFKSSFEYEQSRAAAAAQKVLDQIDDVARNG